LYEKGEEMKIRRRIGEDGKYKTIIEEATLVKRNSKTVLVKLDTGDIIKRRNSDIVDYNEKGEKK